MAAELKLVEPTQKVTLIHSRDKLLSNEPLPDDYRDKSAEILRETGVELILNERPSETVAVESEDGSPRFRLTLKDGSHMFAGNVIRAISKAIPSTSFLPETALDSEGYVKVDSKYASLHHTLPLLNLTLTHQSQLELQIRLLHLPCPLCMRRHGPLVWHQALWWSHGTGPPLRSQHLPTDPTI